MRKGTLFFTLGAIGGLVAWLAGEWVFGRMLEQDLEIVQRFFVDGFYGLITGFLLGTALGLGHWKFARGRWWVLPLGAGLGSIGGCVGLLWGEALFQLLKTLELLGRSVGWGLFGFVLGSSQGISRGSWRGAIHASFGGAIGGVVGGSLFAILPNLTSLPDPACRGIAWVLIGALIGGTSAFFERLLAEATLKIASGKLEGKEFVLDKPKLTIGRDERCDIPIYYDRSVQPRHAQLEWTGAGYRITPIGNASVFVNGLPVPVKELNHNDIILVGQTRLVYRLRAKEVAYLCAACYAPNRKGAKFCSRCGQPFVPMEIPKEPVTQWLKQVGLALLVFVGCLGIGYGVGSWIGRESSNVVKVAPTLSPKPVSSLTRRWQMRPLRLAVTPAGFDDIGAILREMGFPVTELSIENVEAWQNLSQFDCVFINCSESIRTPFIRRYLAPYVQAYVQNGGVVYGSDFAALLLEEAFPQQIRFNREVDTDPESLGEGDAETVIAEVVDTSLRDFLQVDKVSLHFDKGGWYGVEQLTPYGRVFLQSTFWRVSGLGIRGEGVHEGGQVIFPSQIEPVMFYLLVAFPFGQGFVIYTSFHNKAQPSEIERRLIEFLALRPLTIRLSRKVAEEISRTPVEVGTIGEKRSSGLLTGRRMVMQREIIGEIGSGQKSPVYQFQLAYPSPLRIVVGWEGGKGDFIVMFWKQDEPSRYWKQRAQEPPLVLTVPQILSPGVYCVQLFATQAPLPKTPFVIGIGIATQ